MKVIQSVTDEIAARPALVNPSPDINSNPEGY